MQFPALQASNLNGDKLNLPENFIGQVNLLLVAFQQWQQSSVNTWLPFAENLEARLPEFHYYELPTIRKMNFLARTFIDSGMRAGIPDPDTRARTITLYLDKDEFRDSLDINDESRIHLFLVDRSGNVLWRGQGEYKLETADQLIQQLRRVLDQNQLLAEPELAPSE